MQDVGLKELIEQVKQELTAPNKDPNPVFFVDKIELELAVKVTKEANGSIKIAILNFFEAGGGGSLGSERGNTVRVSISPLLGRDEIIQTLIADKKVHDTVLQKSVQTFTKED